MFPIDDFTLCWNILISRGGVRRTDEGRESWEYPGKAWTASPDSRAGAETRVSSVLNRVINLPTNSLQAF